MAKTSKKVASDAGRVLGNPDSTKLEREIAGAALREAARKAQPKKAAPSKAAPRKKTGK